MKRRKKVYVHNEMKMANHRLKIFVEKRRSSTYSLGRNGVGKKATTQLILASPFPTPARGNQVWWKSHDPFVRRGQIHEIHRYEGDLIDEPQSTVSAISKSEKLWPNLKFESGMKEFIIVSTTNSTPSTYFGFRQCNKIEESTISQNGCKSQERSSLWSLRYKSNLCS